MSLRTKCALLILAFEFTLAVTLVLTVRYIGAYFENAAGIFAASSSGLADINRLRTHVRSELNHLLQFVPHPATRSQCQLCQDFAWKIEAAAAAVSANISNPAKADLLQLLRDHAVRREVAVADYLKTVESGGTHEKRSERKRPPPRDLESGENARLDTTTAFHSRVGTGLEAVVTPATVRFDPNAHISLDRFLGRLEAQLLGEAQAAIKNPYRAQQKAILLLSVNAIVGAILGILGLVLVRRWVLAPIRELKHGTDEIGRGNLDHRISITSSDELGQLSVAVNRMSSDLARIEKQMIRRERLAAMGELISYVAHNIRNPLAGIQASTEATQRQLSEGSPLRAHQDAIVAAVDRFQRWLRELEHTCSPMEVRAEPNDIRELIDNVATVFRPMADRRSIVIERRLDEAIRTVNIDPRHFEQALAAIAGNAIEASGDRGRVVIGTEANGDNRQWLLYVADSGPGIPANVIDRIFEPSYTTKRNGHGLGLALARKVIELHGGQIMVECPPEGGTVIRISMPEDGSTRRTDD